ncbi:MAG TPA: serine/threonine-protein kinase [Myxococcales bacterium]|nr:serine/threonine-protein kinase [Myxococcales bacterium]
MLAAGALIGKYVVRRKIAEGGMAEIYLCSSRGPEGFEKDVVIKRIRSFLAGDESFVRMFIAEARVASLLNHANLVQIFDFDKHEDTYYLAMEYVRGHSLWDVRKRAKELMEPMPSTLVAHVGAEVARGLGYAHRLSDKGHSLNLVHRDVTPHNVLLSFDGAVKLTDFGVAKHSASSTAAGVLKGKFAYMSPEQSRGEPLDARTDLFALGIVLWEMLTGGRLFDGDSDVAVLRAVQSSAIAPPARVNPEVPEPLSAVVMKALERDPAQRYQTAQELERALAGFVLAHAKSVDDTDLGGYLRGLYAEELAQEAAREGPRSASAPSGEPRKEPTAMMHQAAAAAELSAPVSPDEDVHASTHVVDRSRPRTEVRSNPSAPTLELPATPAAALEAAAPPPPPPARRSSPSLPKVIADLPAPSAPAPAERGSGPRAAPAAPPTTMTLPAVRRPSRATVGMRRALVVTGLLGVGIAAAGVTIVVSRNLDAPAPAPAPVAAAQPPPPAAAAPEPAPADAPPPSGEPAAGTISSTSATEPAPETEAVRQGTLQVKVRPYADVVVDGKTYRKELQGTASFPLPAGPHRVRLVHPSEPYEATVNIRPGKVTPVEHNFLK